VCACVRACACVLCSYRHTDQTLHNCFECRDRIMPSSCTRKCSSSSCFVLILRVVNAGQLSFRQHLMALTRPVRRLRETHTHTHRHTCFKHTHTHTHIHTHTYIRTHLHTYVDTYGRRASLLYSASNNNQAALDALGYLVLKATFVYLAPTQKLKNVSHEWYLKIDYEPACHG